MELTLHKLPEGFIITSDEEVKNKDIVFYKHPLHEKTLVTKIENWNYSDYPPYAVQHTEGFGVREGYKKVIAQQDQLDFSALSEEEQKKIGWFDVEKLIGDYYEELRKVDTDRTGQSVGLPRTSKERTHQTQGFEDGFLKAQELLSDRVFTLKELLDFLNNEDNHTEGELGNSCIDVRTLINFVSQPKSWKIEVEMEWITEGDEQHDEGGTLPGALASYQQPKFTGGKLKILKIKH